MLGKLIVGASLVGLTFTAVAVAQTSSPNTTTPPKERVEACMKAATAEKRADFKTAKGRYEAAIRSIRDAYKREKQEAKENFAAARAACGAGRLAPTPPKEEELFARVQLLALGGSAITGTAELRGNGDNKVKVKVRLEGVATTSTNPVYIHAGSCANLGAVKYPLNVAVGGRSETTLNISFDRLKAEAPLAINVMARPASLTPSVACGDIRF